jgi:tRNA-binding EMAP/Myf-like protein
LLEKVWHHETADKLFCEDITFGDSGVEPRQVASGLRAHYTLEQMTGKRVLVVCNLKPAKMVGFESAGMVLAAKHEDGRVELVAPPEGASLGEAVTVEGLAVEEGWVPWAPNRINNKKVWQAVAADLKTNADCQVTWKDQVITTSAGACAVPSASNAPVS